MRDWSLAEESAGRAEFHRWRWDQGERVGWDWADMAVGERRTWVQRAKAVGRLPFEGSKPGAVVMIGRTSLVITPEVRVAVPVHYDRLEAGAGEWTDLAGDEVFRCRDACAYCESRWKTTLGSRAG